MARPKQNELPAIEGEGVAPKKVKAIDTAADAYVEIHDTRTKLAEEETAARETLVLKMQEHNLTTYRYGDHVVQILPGKTKVKVKTVDDLDGDGDEDLEGED